LIIFSSCSDILYQDPFATYNPTPFYKFTSALPQIDVPGYIAAYTPRNFPERVIVTYPPYVTSLSDVLFETPTEIVEAYLVTRAALALSPNLGSSTEAWQAQRSLEETLRGIKKGAVGDRAEICTSVVEENLGFAAGRYYVNQTFGGESREKGTKVITGMCGIFLLLFVEKGGLT
jgi:endothelin-converting enzyme